jgi:hypothetical protein
MIPADSSQIYYTPEEVAKILRFDDADGIRFIKRQLMDRKIGGTVKVCGRLRVRCDQFHMWRAACEARTAGY